jgi:hypothetical protein
VQPQQRVGAASSPVVAAASWISAGRASGNAGGRSPAGGVSPPWRPGYPLAGGSHCRPPGTRMDAAVRAGSWRGASAGQALRRPQLRPRPAAGASARSSSPHEAVRSLPAAAVVI